MNRGAVSVRTFVRAPLLLLLLPLFLAFLVPYGPESAPFTPSRCCAPSPAVALTGGGASQPNSMALLRRCAPIGEESRLRTEDTVGGETKRLCAPGVLVVVVVVVFGGGGGVFVEQV